ncbi:MAG: efflux RND transporter periplasmic adaptor subunit, partial [Candidatus Eisenbacteria bacterium]
APLLFLIAEDLSEMEILASVDESDIGKIREGQQVRFTVQAYPNESFQGTVGQVRLQSTNLENVVNYTVAIALENPDGRLLPGMTATVDFIVKEALDVLKVPSAALRFRPTKEMTASARRDRSEGTGEGPLHGKRAGGAGAGGGSSAPAGRQSSDGARLGDPGEGYARLWCLDAKGGLAAVRVETGISDGQFTEIRGADVREGMQVIAAVASGSNASTVNPFQSQQSRGFRGPPPGM